MRRLKMLGWVLVVLGFFVLLAPYISNSTGFFATLYAASLPVPTKLDFNVGMIIFAPVVIAIGYVLVRKKDEQQHVETVE